VELTRLIPTTKLISSGDVHPITDTIRVLPGQAGKVWSFRFDTTSPLRFTLELSPPLPGYAATDAARLAVFEE
jgi:hypothetical protein